MPAPRHVVTALKNLESKINNDTRSRNAFLADPGEVLRNEGVELTAAREKQLKTFLAKQTKVPGGKVTGASIRASGAAAVEVEVTVKVKF